MSVTSSHRSVLTSVKATNAASLKRFVCELLRSSRSSYTVFATALCYLEAIPVEAFNAACSESWYRQDERNRNRIVVAVNMTGNELENADVRTNSIQLDLYILMLISYTSLSTKKTIMRGPNYHGLHLHHYPCFHLRFCVLVAPFWPPSSSLRSSIMIVLTRTENGHVYAGLHPEK